MTLGATSCGVASECCEAEKAGANGLSGTKLVGVAGGTLKEAADETDRATCPAAALAAAS
jgi:hypothetical protein